MVVEELANIQSFWKKQLLIAFVEEKVILKNVYKGNTLLAAWEPKLFPKHSNSSIFTSSNLGVCVCASDTQHTKISKLLSIISLALFFTCFQNFQFPMLNPCKRSMKIIHVHTLWMIVYNLWLYPDKLFLTQTLINCQTTLCLDTIWVILTLTLSLSWSTMFIYNGYTQIHPHMIKGSWKFK